MCSSWLLFKARAVRVGTGALGWAHAPVNGQVLARIDWKARGLALLSHLGREFRGDQFN